MDLNEAVAAMAWALSSFSVEGLTELRAPIRTYEQRLQGTAPSLLDAAIVEAVLGDAAADSALTAALDRAARLGIRRKMRQADQN